MNTTSKRFFALMHGQPEEVIAALDTEGQMVEADVRAALQNAMRMIHELQDTVCDLQDEVRALRQQVPDNR